MAQETSDKKEWPNMYDEAHDMIIISSAMFFLSKMRRLAREGKMPDETTAAPLMELPITIEEISNALDANEDVICDVEGATDFGEKLGIRRVKLHAQMLRTSLRATLLHDPNPDQTWQIIDFADENPDKGLVYSIAVDDDNKRIVVPFRGSMTHSDWLANFNFFPHFEINPLANGIIDREERSSMEQPKNLVMHRGFHNYVFDPDHDADTAEDADNIEATKFNIIFERVAKVLQERPGYDLYTTGISLGGALSTVFALHAAAKEDDRIPKPITCYNFGSPKVGAMSFRKAFQSLEMSGKLRCMRVANQDDLIKELPFNPLRLFSYCIPYPCEQWMYYRHVGMTLFLHKKSGFSFHYYHLTNSYWKVLFGDCSYHCTSFKNVLKNCCITSASNIKHNHGYPEYLHRLEQNREALRLLDLHELYEKAKHTKVSHKYRPYRCFSIKDYEGEIVMHYH